MAIYRAEQARLSVHGEAGHGGYLDYISSITDASDWTAFLNGAMPAGTRTITFDTASGILAVENYVQIGTAENSEVRKVVSLPDVTLMGAVADDGGVMTVQTAGALNTTINDMTLLPATPAVNDAYYFGGSNPFTVLVLTTGTSGNGSWTITWEYYNGSSWASLTGVTDGTSGLTVAAGTSYTNWTLPTDWSTTSISNITAYWVRARVSAYTSVVAAPVGTQAVLRSALTLNVDYPLGFHHKNNEAIDEKTATSVVGSSMATFLPGIYESITVPDLTPEFLPQYFLSTTTNRNWSRMYRGKQTFNGSLPNFIMLNGYGLRFPIGKIATVGTDASGGGGSDVNGATLVGDRLITVNAATNYTAGDFIQIDTGNNAEVRQIVSISSEALTLNYPLMIAHANAVVCNEVTSPYTHTIVETSEINSLTWNLLIQDDSGTTANDFIRRYIGGIVNRATLSADEGGMLRFSWDDVQFLDLVHNQTASTGVSGEIVKSSAALIDPTQGSSGDPESGIGGAIPHDGGALGDANYPTTEPYHFSQGDISFFGVTFARIRNFRLEINNNIEARYYIKNNGSDRIANDFQEQRREYRLTASVAMEDSLAATSTTKTLWKELLLEGNYDSGFVGFNLTITFTRGTNDTITLTLPSSTASDALNSQGSFVVRAPTNVGTESPQQIDIEMLVRDIDMVIVDSVAVYP